jgi:subtilisin family serine protease
VKLHNHKILGNDGSGYNQWIYGGIEAAIDKKLDFLSWSWGGGGPDPQMLALAKAFIGQGGYIFAAAGNSSARGRVADEDYPAKYPEIPGVAAIGKDGLLTDFSSYGPGVVCCAPGYQMLSTIPGGYGLMSGTSMATPCVVGVAAVILAEMLNRGLPRPSLVELVALIQRTAKVANNLRIINPETLLKEIAKTPLPPPVNSPPTGKITFGPLPIPMLGYAVSLVLDPITGAKSDPVMAEAAMASMKKMLEQASAP